MGGILGRNLISGVGMGVLWAAAYTISVLYGNSAVGVMTSVLAFASLGAAGWFGWQRPWLSGLVAAVVGYLIFATLFTYLAANDPTSNAGTGELAQYLAGNGLLQAGIGAVAGFVGGYLRMNLRRPGDAPAAPHGEPSSLGAGETVPTGSTIVRLYRGKQQGDAVSEFQRDAQDLAIRGYRPLTQSWAPGQWGLGAFLISIVLMIVIVGFVIFLYLLIVKPEGTLTVTYAQTGAALAPAAPVEPSSTRIADTPLAIRLAELSAARDAGHLTDDEYAAKRADIIGRF